MENKVNKENKSESNQPMKRFQAGAISATVWKNPVKKKDGSDGEFLSISFKRSYQDKDGEWKDTNSLRPADIPKAALVLNKAYEYVSLNKENELNISA